jgi:hypothetical protein
VGALRLIENAWVVMQDVGESPGEQPVGEFGNFNKQRNRT